MIYANSIFTKINTRAYDLFQHSIETMRRRMINIHKIFDIEQILILIFFNIIFFNVFINRFVSASVSLFITHTMHFSN